MEKTALVLAVLSLSLTSCHCQEPTDGLTVDQATPSAVVETAPSPTLEEWESSSSPSTEEWEPIQREDSWYSTPTEEAEDYYEEQETDPVPNPASGELQGVPTVDPESDYEGVGYGTFSDPNENMKSWGSGWDTLEEDRQRLLEEQGLGSPFPSNQ